jgi:hypothetical protein
MTPCSPPSRTAVARWPRLDGVWSGLSEDGFKKKRCLRSKQETGRTENLAQYGCMRRCHRHKVQLRPQSRPVRDRDRRFRGCALGCTPGRRVPPRIQAVLGHLVSFADLIDPDFAANGARRGSCGRLSRSLRALREADGSGRVLGLLSDRFAERFCSSLPRNRSGVGMGYLRSSL